MFKVNILTCKLEGGNDNYKLKIIFFIKINGIYNDIGV